MPDIRTEIGKYRAGWCSGLPETPCGLGSTLSETEKQREWIPRIFRKYGIRTVADIGAGDLNWISHMDMDGVTYQPYDLVPRNPQVERFDILTQVPPKSDLIMCLWVLNHFPMNHCSQALENIKASGSKYLLMTDRTSYRKGQPPEIDMPYIECISIKKDCSIRLIDLEQC